MMINRTMMIDGTPQEIIALIGGLQGRKMPEKIEFQLNGKEFVRAVFEAVHDKRED